MSSYPLPLAGRRILLAEDEVHARAPYEAAFRAAGAAVTAVGDGAAAVRSARAADEAGAPFHAAVLDQSMPLLDGADAALALRLARFPGLVIGLTAGVGPDDARRWRRNGCAFLLPKSLSPALLVARVAAAAERPRAAVHATAS